MSELNSTASATPEKTFDATIDKTLENLRPVLEPIMATLHDTVERLGSIATKAANKVELSGECLKDSQVRMTGACRGYVRAKPLTSIGLALASGYVLSWILRQR